MNSKVIIQAPKDSGVPESARDFSVRDRVVVITGGGQGIGREYARQFAAAGAVPVVADLSADHAENVLKEIKEAGGKGMAARVDVGDEGSVAAMVEQVIARFGRVDVLVNNAAIFATLQKRSFEEIPVSEWEQVMRVNVTGSFLCARAVAPAMREAKWGRIVNISTSAINRGTVNYLHYVASKAAVIGMTNSMARELGPHGITVNCIRPGGVATEVDRTANPTEESRTRLLKEQCLPRGQMPSDMVGIVMFLATQASSFITGQTIACDGGFTHNS
jgi:NAD(P)-dependent dehydrogenase (short-subunit alcohol dehydrogenase family)